jgi:hypothetical protein
MDEEITERIAHPCPECGGVATRLIPCDPPPPKRLLEWDCLVSADRAGIVSWRYCARITPRRMVVFVYGGI